MRSNLTFLGFLRQYVKELSGESTLSIKRLASCCGDFPKLREPLFLYAVFSGQLQTLHSALQAESNESLQKLCDDFGDIVTLDMLQQKSELLPERMYRVWTSYVSVRDCTATENHLKEIIRKEIISFLSSKKVSVYQVCKDLEMNQGNVSRWLNHGNPGAINYHFRNSPLQILLLQYYLYFPLCFLLSRSSCLTVCPPEQGGRC